MDSEFKEQLKDRFEGFELVEYLQLTTEEIIYAFEDKIIDCKEDLDEFLKYGR